MTETEIYKSASNPITIFQGKFVIWTLLTDVRVKCTITSFIQSTVLAMHGI